ncbi:ATP-dependent RNA helicase DHX57 [Angomonas deanei]|uniref:RNA helicase n=1 Tax=Angomonas deanei TaxID=59799 RepID=A0A7G2CQS8_9TRYP|nr:ATP-dependent RNA helicase DHX57 [Angomonas deanei]CAD2220542.1 DEAD/DEAH box helicase/Helicase conserved C-terminal domain/Helicase associated domain (HA2), putative [Angomonas deanei]|eukprot:EPY28260.1 ATP-dependent RNA helicase DHX57 [Angomonas deanei]
MGPNRQRRAPAAPRRGRGRGHPPAQASAKAVAPSMINSAGREMIIDVLQHAASGGNVPVPEKHFNASAGAKITLQRNSPLTPAEVIQRLFEGLGFPRDLVTQFITDIQKDANLPEFNDVSDLLEEGGRFQPFLIQSCFELFNCMTWFGREQPEGEGETTPEEGDEILTEEVETIKDLFSDSFLCSKHFEDDSEKDRELYFSFLTQDQRPVVVVIRFTDYYPTEPPSLYLQAQKAPCTSGSAPDLCLVPSCTKDLSATERRSVMDAAIDTMNAITEGGCLMPLVSSVAAAIGELKKEEAEAAPAVSKDELIKQRQEKENQRKAFIGALTGKKEAKNDDDDEDRFIQVSLPKEVELATITDDTKVDHQRKEFTRRDKRLDDSLKAEWEKLKTTGSLRASREGLPAYLVREQLRSALKEHNIVVIGGETGSGKTTQIPQYLYEFMCEEGRGSVANIVCTQPRRLAATSVALRVAEERDETVGGSVGYTIRLESCTSKRTQLTYCTTGIVLRRLQTDKFLGNVSHVVVDEIHERGVDTDFLLILLKDLVQRRPDLKVVLMSATMDSQLFSRYFGGAPTISIQGRTFPVNVMHLEQIIPAVHYFVEDGSPYAKRSQTGEAARRRNTRKNQHVLDFDDVEDDLDQANQQKQLAKKINASAQTLDTISHMDLDVINYELIEAVVLYIDTTLRIEGAVLIFLPGMAEIQKCVDQLKSSEKLSRTCCFYNLHSTLGSSEQQGVFKRPPKGKRKIIVGTNIMETSITIDDAVFVIDSGKAKENRYNARKSLSELVTVSVSKANCKQRQGRAGRVREGYCFRLFTEAQFDSFDDHQLCEMHRVPLESLILQIYALRLGDEVEYLQKALSPPEEKAINSSVRVLKTLGALTAEKRLTSLGLHLANLPLDVRVGKMIIHGALLQCIDPVLTVAACLSTRSPIHCGV